MLWQDTGNKVKLNSTAQATAPNSGIHFCYKQLSSNEKWRSQICIRMTEKGNKLWISRLRGIWKSGYKKIGLIHKSYRGEYQTHKQGQEVSQDNPVCPFPPTSWAASCRQLHMAKSFHHSKETQTSPGFWQDQPILALSVPQPAVFQTVQGQKPPKRTKHKELCKQSSLCVDCGLFKILPGLGPSWMFLSFSPNRTQTCRIKMLCCDKKCQKDILM